VARPGRLPTGTVTFVFTDIEGSTRASAELGARWPEVLDAHFERIVDASARHGGVQVASTGDGLFLAFAHATDAVFAALDAQRALGENFPLRVRIGVHTGEAQLLRDDYVGLAVHHAARVCDAANGGQVILSEASRPLAEPLPPGASLIDLGIHRLRDIEAPQRLYRLAHRDLPADERPPRTLTRRLHNLPADLTPFARRVVSAPCLT
jgi:class 3 adenylate cyclase